MERVTLENIPPPMRGNPTELAVFDSGENWRGVWVSVQRYQILKRAEDLLKDPQLLGRLYAEHSEFISRNGERPQEHQEIPL